MAAPPTPAPSALYSPQLLTPPLQTHFTTWTPEPLQAGGDPNENALCSRPAGLTAGCWPGAPPSGPRASGRAGGRSRAGNRSTHLRWRHGLGLPLRPVGRAGGTRRATGRRRGRLAAASAAGTPPLLQLPICMEPTQRCRDPTQVKWPKNTGRAAPAERHRKSRPTSAGTGLLAAFSLAQLPPLPAVGPSG